MSNEPKKPHKLRHVPPPPDAETASPVTTAVTVFVKLMVPEAMRHHRSAKS